MAIRVPYNEQKVDIAPIRIAQARPDTAGAAAGQALAKGLGDVANIGLRIAREEQEKHDKAVIDKAEYDLISTYDKSISDASQVAGRAVMAGFDEDGKENKDAPDLVTQYATDFKETRAKLEEGLTERQRAAFRATADRYELGLSRHVMSHQIKQTELWQTEQHASLAAKIGQSLEAVTTPALPGKDLDALKEKMNLVFGKISAERAEAEYTKAIESIEKNRVAGAIKRGDVTAARAIFDKALDSKHLDPNGPTGSDLTHMLNSAEATEKGTQFVSSIWRQPATNAPVTNLEEMYSSIDKAVKDKKLTPEAARVAEAELSQKITRHNQQTEINLHLIKSDIWQGVNDGSINLKSALAKVDAAAMPGDDRIRMKRAVELHFKPPRDPAAILEQKMAQAGAMADIQEKMINGEVRIQNLKDAMAYVPDIGLANASKLYQFGQKYEKALANPQIAPEQIAIAVGELAQAGVNLPPEKVNGKANPEYLAMKGYVLDALVNEQVTKGVPLTGSDANKAIKRIMSDRQPVFMKGGWFHLPNSIRVEEKPAWQVKNPESIDVKGLLTKKLGREPTQKEIEEGQAKLVMPARTRKALQFGARFGGNNGD